MMKRSLSITNKLIVAIGSFVFIFFLVFLPMPSSANGMQAEMNRLFGSMTNTTSPGVYETQRRGVLSGGRFTMKNRIYNESIFNITPPSISAGCGGIDFFGGSFSFINSEQIVQLMRSIAANAKGYAFNLALQFICESCLANIETFLKKLQSLNQHLGNSCQLAQGIVNDITDVIPLDFKGKTQESLVGSAKGLFTDFFESVKPPSGKTAGGELRKYNPDEYEKFVGNLIWKELRDNGTQYWFTYGDKTLLETIMSLTGTVIVQEPIGSDEDATQNIVTLAGHKVKLHDLVFGGTGIEIYACPSTSSDCMNAGQSGSGVRTINLEGIGEKIYKALAGPTNSTGEGIIGKLARNSGSLTNSERALMDNLPSSIGATIVQLSALSEPAARAFVSDASNSLGVVISYHMVTELFRAARSSLATMMNPYKPLAEAEMNRSFDAVHAEYARLIDTYGSTSDLLNKYNNLIVNIRKQRYTTSQFINRAR